MLKLLIESLIPIIIIAVTGFISVMALWVKFWLTELYKDNINLLHHIKRELIKIL